MKRLIRWFVVNVLFALTPLIASLVIHWCADKLPISGWAIVPEIVFFSVMISVTAFTDILEISEVIGWDVFLTFTGLALLVGAVWSAVMYGVFVYGHVLTMPTPTFQYRFLYCAKSVAVVLFALSVAVEVFISRVKASDETV